MTGKLKTKGNMMFATKLQDVLKVRSYTSQVKRGLLTLRESQAARNSPKL